MTRVAILVFVVNIQHVINLQGVIWMVMMTFDFTIIIRFNLLIYLNLIHKNSKMTCLEISQFFILECYLLSDILSGELRT